MRGVLGILLLGLVGTFSVIGTGLSNSKGTLVGTLRSVWLRKYPMIVYLEKVDGAFQPPREKPTIDQKNKRFIPHLLPVLKGTTIHYVNHDDTKHNVYFIRPDGKKINLGTGRGNWSKDQRMDQVGIYVHHCNIHDEMSAYVVVLDNPYYALVERRASRKPAVFKLKGVPAGSYKLRVWCEKFYTRKGHRFNRPWDVSIKAGQQTQIEVKP